MKFPREVWAGSHLKNAPQMKRQIVKSKQEYTDWVNTYNGIMNCYTTVYDFADFTDNAKVDSSVILDKMFLDFDAHDEPLENAWSDFKDVWNKFQQLEIRYDAFFSGKGFHIIAYGDIANDIRSIQEYYTELAKDYPTLDRTGIQTNRLRRIPNTLNLSSDGYFCIPIPELTLYGDNTLEVNDLLIKANNIIPISPAHGVTLIQWPNVRPVSISETLIEVPEAIGRIPILPCLQNAITVENPSHMARVYLVQWYRDLLSLGIRELSTEQQKEIVDSIMGELEHLASLPDMWLDWDANVTRKNVAWIVKKGYHAPGCKNSLIPQGYCVGKCWRYHE